MVAQDLLDIRVSKNGMDWSRQLRVTGDAKFAPARVDGIRVAAHLGIERIELGKIEGMRHRGLPGARSAGEEYRLLDFRARWVAGLVGSPGGMRIQLG